MKNSYEQQARKEDILDGITKDLETKHDVKNSAIETVKDLVVGVIGGGVVGAAIGKASLAIGAVVTGIGHYYKSRLASTFGIGMMAANGFQKKDEQFKGAKEQDTLEGVKERVLNFKDTFSQKLFLDKILKSKKKEKQEKQESTNGVGEVQYFTYPNKELEGAADMSALEKMERQVAASAAAHEQRKQEFSDNLPGEEITGGEMGDLDPADRNY